MAARITFFLAETELQVSSKGVFLMNQVTLYAYKKWPLSLEMSGYL